MSETALIVMARYPQPGTTKTRLARTLGNEKTLKLYQAFLTDLADRFAGQRYDLHWAFTPPEANYAAFTAELVPQVAEYTRSFPQQGADLGARLHHAFQWACQKHYTATIVIGSDSPHITHAMVEQAEEALNEVDVVLGPADDGGYYLIAMREPHDVFSYIPMSTSAVTEMTTIKAQQQGLMVRLIEPLFDIDEHADLLRLAALLRVNSALAPATAAQIATFEELIYAHDSTCSRETTDGHAAALDLYRTH